MSKLRKSAPMSPTKSRTMALAQTAARIVASPGSAAASGHLASNTSRYPVGAHISTHVQGTSTAITLPKTGKEQYWAERALTAETLLSAKVIHHKELKSVTSEADTKRAQEINLLRKAHEARESRLETVVIILLVLLLSIAAMFAYSLHTTAKVERSRKSSNMHFTIPILSPFASVVEHETSVIGPKSLMAFAAISAICLYGCFRYWLTHRKA
ncbi:hypothetical protein BDY19DRAFT_994285 [Irpex rosettiformis]|uniref:Uncharacterized protein n=1 Tax=Irpex rosettiformis TaxID=378272 RepID=A0ACB8U2C2_9APHY|nr:hypothetical protein BDY19DRAFT_994285 [Irpex rosettiformis]